MTGTRPKEGPVGPHTADFGRGSWKYSCDSKANPKLRQGDVSESQPCCARDLTW